MKKILALFLAGMILCLSAVGCSKATNSYSFSIYVEENKDVRIVEMIQDYISLNPDKRIEIVRQPASANESDRLKLQADLMAGRGPDVLVVSDKTFSDINKTMASGAFYDLNEFLLTDEDYNPDSYFRFPFQAGEFEGRQCMIPYSFELPLLLTTQKLLDKNEFDAALCQNYQGYLHEIAELIRKNQTNKEPYLIFGNENELQNPFYHFTPDLLNFQSKNVELDTETIEALMKDYKLLYQYKQKRENSVFLEIGGVAHYVDEEKLLFAYTTRPSLLDDAAMIAINDAPILLPIRDTDGKLSATVSSALAISQNSKNKEEGYQFIKYLLSSEIQSNDKRISEYPVLKPALFNAIESKRAQYETGLLLGQDNSTDKNYPVKNIDDAFIANYLSLIDEVQRCHFFGGFPTKLFSFLHPYLKDEDPLDDCLQKAQEQLEIYISE